MSYNESGLKEEIIKEKTTKKVTEKDNKFIVSVKRYMEFYAIIDGIKSDDISIASPCYDFIFDKNTGELIEYIPYDTQEMTLMKTDITKLFDSEKEARREEKRLSRENYISLGLVKNEELTLRYNSNNVLNRINVLNYTCQSVYGFFSNIGNYKWYDYNSNDYVLKLSSNNYLYR